MFIINHAIKFKYQPTCLNVNANFSWLSLTGLLPYGMPITLNSAACVHTPGQWVTVEHIVLCSVSV